MSLPKLPQLLDRKIYKTGQTRGADDDVIYQNRVGRNSTVLIPYNFWKDGFRSPPGEETFENGYIVLIPPNDYFEKQSIDKELSKYGLEIGKNALISYETREQWDKNNPEKLGWRPAQKRVTPLEGHYIARIPATTATTGGDKIVRGFNTTQIKGAGIRVFEYASASTIKRCRLQLEALFWLCKDAEAVVLKTGMLTKNIVSRKQEILKICLDEGLLDFEKLRLARVVNKEKNTTCPLCLEALSGRGFFDRMHQAAGREVHDITVTEINLFHIEELRTGAYNHCPYNIGWGHHHCNVVTKDAGIKETLDWMHGILERNIKEGYLASRKKS